MRVRVRHSGEAGGGSGPAAGGAGLPQRHRRACAGQAYHGVRATAVPAGRRPDPDQRRRRRALRHQGTHPELRTADPLVPAGVRQRAARQSRRGSGLRGGGRPQGALAGVVPDVGRILPDHGPRHEPRETGPSHRGSLPGDGGEHRVAGPGNLPAMKAKRQDIGLYELKRQLAAGVFAPVSLVVGEEAVLRDDAVAAIRAAVLGPDEANIGVFNSDVVYGDETEAAEILTLCGNLPMFATRRLVVVKEVGALGAHEAERLLPYLEAPVETTCLVLTGGKVDGRLKFFQALKQVAVTVACAPLDARALPAWVQDQAGVLGLRLEEAARELLIQASRGAIGGL